jgi:zinc D-Ala-D-Ala carboxypeptidase
MKHEFMAKLQKLRETYGAPMKVTSGYRCPQHPIEAKKSAPGAHASGLACDIGVQGEEAHRLLALALEAGFTGIGVQQKGQVVSYTWTQGQKKPCGVISPQ